MRVGPSPIPTDPGSNKQRRGKRNIPKLILTELSFSGNGMTTSQIAAAIDYVPELTARSLKRLESYGKVILEKDGRWSSLMPLPRQSNGAATKDRTFSITNGQHKE